MPASPRPPRRRLRGLLAAALAGAALLVPAAAHAASLSTQISNTLATVKTAVDASVSGGCSTQTTSQRFLPFSDQAQYWQVLPTPAWTLVGAPVKTATVTTPTLCLGVDSPTIRLYVSGAKGSSLTVSVIGPLGNVVPIGKFSPSTALAPSPVLPVLVNLLAPLGSSQSVGVRFVVTASGGTVNLGEFWVDPFKRV